MSMENEGAGPSTTTIEMDAPIRRDADQVLEARREVTVSKSGMQPLNLAQFLEVAQTMAKAQVAIPEHLRGSPGACLAVLEYAHGWGLMAYAVANKSYMINNRLAFESQLIHAVIEMHAPLHEDSLNFEHVGEGPTRRCRVWAQCKIRGKVKVLTWEGTEFKDIKVRNSPLWQSKLDLQLFYNSSRDWARVYFPHILLGAYSNDEMPGDDARDVTPQQQAIVAHPHEGPEGYHPANVDALQAARAQTNELDEIATDAGPESPQESPAQNTEQGAASPGGATGDAQAQGAGPSERKQRKKAEPKPEVLSPPEPVLPKNQDEYLVHLQGWASKATDDAYIHDRWQDEKDLRGRCGVIDEHFKKAKEIKDARLKEITG